MLQIHANDLDAGQLQKHLNSLLDQGRKRAPADQYLISATSPSPFLPLRQWLKRWAWVRRVHNKVAAWRMSGWNIRWLVRQTPLLGTFAWYVSGKLTMRGFRQHALNELHELRVANHRIYLISQQLQARLDQMESAFEQSQERARQRENDLLQEIDIQRCRQAQMVKDVRRLEQRAASLTPFESELFPEWYLSLENQCRGGVDDIETRISRYLPYLDCARVGQAEWPVLDLGCGRGEWLHLLERHQIVAFGVDNNAAMLHEARQLGLRVVESDIITLLRATDSESIGAVTAFQVVEHLDQNTLLDLFQQAFRVLRPGGVLLLETPNPENLQVAAYSFWLDPTHVQPIPAPLLAHSATYFGFIDICIERSNPWSETMRLEDASEAARHLEKLLFSGQDYALIARKPYAPEATPTITEY